MKTTHIETILRNKGYRVTSGKVAILETMAKAKCPMTAENIHKGLGSHKMDLATVYRNLLQFEKDDLISVVYMRKNISFYEFSVHPEHHHHLICRACNRIEEINQCLEPYLKTLTRKYKYKNVVHSLEFFGLCPACSKS